MTSRLPWLKWYPADWRQEPTLRLCSRAARSLWLDLLGLMHEAEPYGHLLIKGKPPTAKQLAAVLGDSAKNVASWLDELEQSDVFSRTPDGVIYSRRMLRDKERDERNRHNGKSGGNPNLRGEDKAAVNLLDNPGVNPPVKLDVKGAVKAQKPEATRQTPCSNSYKSESDSDSDSDLKINEEGADAGAHGSAASSLAPIPGRQAPKHRRKRPERADQELAQHMAKHNYLDIGAAWWLVMAARDGTSSEHEEAAQRCEAYSKQHRLGWFADEAASVSRAPQLSRNAPTETA